MRGGRTRWRDAGRAAGGTVARVARGGAVLLSALLISACLMPDTRSLVQEADVYHSLQNRVSRLACSRLWLGTCCAAKDHGDWILLSCRCSPNEDRDGDEI